MKTNETRTISTPKRMAAAFLALLTLLFAIPLDGVGITAWAAATYTYKDASTDGATDEESTAETHTYTIKGNGTADDLYQISSADDLIVFSIMVNDGEISGNMDAILLDDIDFSAKSELGGGNW